MQRFNNNYSELSKENVLRNMMLSYWPCFTWKFFMIWFHKILKLIFQKQPSCPRNICTEHWRKLPNVTVFLEIYLYLKNNDSVKHLFQPMQICQIPDVIFESTSQFSFKVCINLQCHIKHNSSVLFLAQTLNTLVKEAN